MSPAETETAAPQDRLELTISDGCPCCDGPVQLRITTWTARALCLRCEYLSSPEIAPGRSGKYELSYPPSAEA